jgi:hypothetical protein
MIVSSKPGSGEHEPDFLADMTWISDIKYSHFTAYLQLFLRRVIGGWWGKSNRFRVEPGWGEWAFQPKMRKETKNSGRPSGCFQGRAA